jgi:ElaB/YqjD/DUF883 family membrane-anchored ribosome-binding protein
MDERTVDRVRGNSEVAARRFVDGAQHVAARAGASVQSRLGDVSDRAQDFAQDANARVERLTGRSIESRAADTRRLVRQHPLAALAITTGLGYVVGKLLIERPRIVHRPDERDHDALQALGDRGVDRAAARGPRRRPAGVARPTGGLRRRSARGRQGVEPHQGRR